MAFVLADRVAETTTTTGTGTLNLAGAVTGFQSFVSGVGDGNTCFYTITDNTDWEVGIGTVTAGSPDTLSRDTILQSTNSDAAVNWGAGTKDVFLSVPADRQPTLNGNNTFTGTTTLTGIAAINGTSSESAGLSLAEDTDNGTNKITIKAPESITADYTASLPDKAGTFAFTSDVPDITYGHLNGLTLSNDTDTDHDINITAGQAADDTNTKYIKLASEITKQVDASWAVGNDQGGLDTGTVANNTWYYVWLIERSDTGVVDVLFSTSSTSPTMPTNYDYKRRIGAFRTDGSANIRPFVQHGDRFIFKTNIRDVNYTAGELTNTAALLTVTVPPSMVGLFRISAEDGSLYGCLVSSPDENDQATGDITASAPASLMGGAGDETAGHFGLRVDSSSRIRARSSVASQNYFIVHTYGWFDLRGK